MSKKPTYEELERRVKELENNAFERKGAEEALQASEVSYRTLAENLPGLVYRVFIHEKNRMHFFNDQLQFMTGYKEEELKKGNVCSIDPLILPEDVAGIITSVEEAIRKETHFEVEYRVTHRDGDIRYFWERGRPILGGDGKPQYIDGTIFDITERKQAEEALRESEERYRALFERSLELVYLCDFEGNFIDANNVALELLGYSKDDIKSLNFMSLLSKDQLPLAAEKAEELLKTGSQKEVAEYKLRRKDGEHVYVESMGAVIYLDGKPSAIQGIARDITERKQAEDQLQIQTNTLEAVFNASPNILTLLDSGGRIKKINNSGIEFSTRESEKILGLFHGEALSCINTFDGDSCGENSKCKSCPIRTKFLSTLNTGESHIQEEGQFTCLFNDEQTTYDLLISTKLLALHGERNVLISLSDISKLKQAEEKSRLLESQLAQSQRIESIGTLAGGIAHDFNNILSSIIGFTELALDDAEKDTELRESLREVYAAGTRAKDLVKQILTISRKDQKETRPIQIVPLIKEALKMLRSTIPTSIEFRENIGSDTLVVRADATQLHQVIVNLVTNAKHAITDEIGILEVGVDRVNFQSDSESEATGLKSGNYARLTISDTGSGISKENIPKIFDPYFTTKEKGEGTGLGLSIVQGIVKSHNGHVAVCSEPGKGTTFHVYLPLVKKSSGDIPESATKTLPMGTERVLFVDDEPKIVKMQQQRLERLGYQVTAKTSSVEAIDVFRLAPHNFDIVISDITMPKMTGDKLAKEMKAIRPDMPIILCTGFSEKVKGHGENLSADGLLMKPVGRTIMAETVRKVLDKAKK